MSILRISPVVKHIWNVVKIFGTLQSQQHTIWAHSVVIASLLSSSWTLTLTLPTEHKMSVALLMPLQYFLNYKHYKNIALFDIKQLAVAKSRCLFQMPRRALS